MLDLAGEGLVVVDRRRLEGDGRRSEAYCRAAVAAAVGYDCGCLWDGGRLVLEFEVAVEDVAPVLLLRGGGGGGGCLDRASS